MDPFSVVLLAAGLALGPTLLYAVILWWLDRYEKEPLPLLLVAFMWGAVPAILLALLLERWAGLPLEQVVLTDQAREITMASLVAPLVEEAFKAVILVVLFLAYRREFDDVLDGVIYGAMVGLGFAFVENTLYYTFSTYIDEPFVGDPNIGHMLGLWVFRSEIFGLNHSMFTAFTGAALGLARSLKIPWQRGFTAAIGLGTAMVFHAVHNSLTTTVGVLSSDEAPRTGLVLGACLGILVSDWGGLLLIMIVAIISGINEGQVIRQTLWEEVALGRFTPDEYATLISGRRRWSVRWSVLFSAGFGRWRQMGKFFDLATELAFRKHRMYDGDPIHQTISARDVMRLRSEIDKLKVAMLYA
ncbi:MAG: PrsW family intramembrane metalloprotease [Chloroflexia bacterium]